MPFVRTKVSCPITEEQEIRLKSGLGKAIELISGKTEEYLMSFFYEDFIKALHSLTEGTD